MSEDQKQTAAEDTEDAASPASEEQKSDAQAKTDDDFEKDLSEFAQAEESSSSEQKAEADDEMANRLKRLEQELSSRVYRDDLNNVINDIRGDFTGDEISDEFIDTWINAEARKDERVAIAWARRHQDPAKFKRVVKGLSEKFAQKHAKFHNRDEESTNTREAVAAAVRTGGSKPAPEGKAPDYSQMSDAEFRESVKKDYGINV